MGRALRKIIDTMTKTISYRVQTAKSKRHHSSESSCDHWDNVWHLFTATSLNPLPALSIVQHHKCIMSSFDTFFDSTLQTASSRSLSSRTATSNKPEQMLENIIMTRGKQSRLLIRKEVIFPLSLPCRSSSLCAAVCCCLSLLTGECALTSAARQLDQEVVQRLLISDMSSRVSVLSSINRFFG